MAYTAVKLADVQAAIAKVTAAQKKYDTAKKSVDPSKSALSSAQSKLQEAQKKLESMRNDFDKQSYLKGNSTYDKAVTAYNDAVKKAKGLEDNLNNRDYLKSDANYKAAQTALSDAQKKVETARNYLESNDYLKKSTTYQSAVTASEKAKKTLETSRNFLDSGDYRKNNTAYQNAVKAQQTAEKSFETARNFLDSNDYLKQNSTYQNSVKAIETAENNRRKAEDALNNANDKNRKSLETALNTANKAVDTAYSNKDKAETAARTAAEKARNTAETTFNTARSNAEKADNTARAAAEKARDAADTAYNKSQQLIDTESNKARTAAETALNTVQKAYDTSNSALDTAENNARVATEKLYNAANLAADTSNKAVETTAETLRTAAQKAVDTQDQLIGGTNKVVGLQTLYDKANDTYQNTLNQIQPDLDSYTEAKNNVSNYVNNIKDSLGDVTTRADADAVKTLLGQISTAVSGTGLSDFKDQINPLISKIDPIKMSNVPQLNSAFKNLNPDVFSNVDRATGMPMLNQAGLDKVLNKYGDNNLSSGQYRDNYNAFGWNSKSDGSSVSRGPAVLGLDIGTVSSPAGGMGATAKGYVKSGTSNPATDDDFKKAAGQLGLDFNSYIKPNKFIPTVSTAMGSSSTEKATAKNSKEYTDPVTGETYLARLDSKGNFTNSLDKAALYNEIADKTKDFYVVSNALESPGANKPAEHAAVLFKADGSGNLVPVVDKDGKVAASYYKTSTVTHAGWQGQLAELAPLIQMAAFVFAPQLGAALNSAIGGVQVAAAVAPTAFTVGVPAMTLSTAIGATAVNAISSAAMNAGMSVLTGGDPLKGALSGAAGAVIAVNAADVANNVMGAGNAANGAKIIAQIADSANLTPQQVNQIVAAGANSAITSAVAGDPNILENVAANVAGQLAGAQAKNIVYDALENSDPKLLVGAATAASNVANLATQTAIKGGDISDAITNAAPSIFIGAAEAAAKIPTAKAPIEERSFTDDSDNTDAQQQVIDAFGQPVSQGVGTQIGDPTAGLSGALILDKPNANNVPIDLPKVDWAPTPPQADKLPEVIVTGNAPPEEVSRELFGKPITAADISPLPVFTPQQKFNSLQVQADAAKTAAMDAAAKYIQNPTPATKAVADKAVLDAEIAQKSADSAKSDLSTTPTTPTNVPLTPVTPPTNVPSNILSNVPSNIPSNVPSATPSNVPSNVSSDASTSTAPSNTLSNVPGSGTSNLLGDSTGITGGLGGTGTGGIGTGGTGTSGSGTSGTGTGTGTGTGAGSGTVSTGGLNQMLSGYTTTTPLAKRPIGDLYPLSHTMMTPEEIAVRSTTQMVRRGGLVSVR